MGDNIKTLFRLYKAYGKIDILWFLRDPKHCLLYVFSDSIAALASLTSIFLLADRFNGFGNMDKNSILFMLSYAMIVEGCYTIFFINNNVKDISRVIARGQMDHKLIQPVPIPIQLLTEGFAPASGSSVLLCGIVLTVYSFTLINIGFTLKWMAALIVCIFCSLFIMLSCVYIVSCLAFYAPAATEELSPEINELFSQLKSYPLGGFHSALQIIFTIVIPVGTAAWLPASILLHSQGISPNISILIITASVFIFAAYTTFKKGMKHYAKYSSQRYSGFGHR